jgi:hypothetical protein
MPINYRNGKIYEIVCRVSGEKYVGSTTQPLSKRLVKHRSSSNSTMSKQIIERGDYYINLLEDFPCDNREQLLQRERHFYDSIEGGCINKRRPCISEEEDKEHRRALVRTYYAENKEHRRAQMEVYRDKNKENMKAYNKAYKKENKEQIKENMKAYYEQNKERIKARSNAQYKKNKEKNIAKIEN